MLKKVICILLAIIICWSFSIYAFAEDTEITDGEIIIIPEVEDAEIGRGLNSNSENSVSTYATYTYVGKKQYYEIPYFYTYECYRKNGSWYVMTGLNLTMAMFHRQGTGDKSLSFTIGQEYTSETATEFSVGVGASAGAGKMVNASVDLGYGITKTKSRSYQVTSTVQATILASSKTGYYKMQICHNFYPMRIFRSRANATYLPVEMAIPYGESYAAVLYSSSNESGTWAKW